MRKKPDERLAEKIKGHEKEEGEKNQTIVPHLNRLDIKHLEKLATSDIVHKRLEDLL